MMFPQEQEPEQPPEQQQQMQPGWISLPAKGAPSIEELLVGLPSKPLGDGIKHNTQTSETRDSESSGCSVSTYVFGMSEANSIASSRKPASLVGNPSATTASLADLSTPPMSPTA